MKEEVLFISCELRDGSVNTWSETMGEISVYHIIERIKYLKDWMGGKFIDIHTFCDGKKFQYSHEKYSKMLKEKRNE